LYRNCWYNRTSLESLNEFVDTPTTSWDPTIAADQYKKRHVLHERGQTIEQLLIGYRGNCLAAPLQFVESRFGILSLDAQIQEIGHGLQRCISSHVKAQLCRRLVTTKQHGQNENLVSSQTNPLFCEEKIFDCSFCTMSGSSARNRRSGKGQVRTYIAAPKGSSRPDAHITRKILLFISAIVLASSLLVSLPVSTISSLRRKWLATPPNVWNSRRNEVKDAFERSWEAYTEHAWGKSAQFSAVLGPGHDYQGATNFIRYRNEARR
jgi:hypothetical protein